MQTITTFPEQLLLREIASGSESAFVRVFDYYRPPIYTLALRYTRNEWVAEEIVQDVFTKVWIHRASLTEVQNFGGWIYKIAEGLTINAVKRLVREREKAEQFVRDPLSFADSATRMEEENKYQALLHEAIQKLPTRQQQTYLLIKQRGLKREEAAKVLKVSPETIKSNLNLAIRMVRAYCLAKMDKTLLLLFVVIG